MGDVANDKPRSLWLHELTSADLRRAREQLDAARRQFIRRRGG